MKVAMGLLVAFTITAIGVAIYLAHEVLNLVARIINM